MTRQRHVYPEDEVAHLWANKAQDSARKASGNMYFKGPTLYSYGSHFVIGHWLDDGRLLWNCGSYSSTTSGQQWSARTAVPRHHWDTALRVPSLDEDDTRKHGWPGLAGKCINAAMSSLEAAQKARQRRAAHIETARDYLHSARELYTLAGQPKAAKLVPDVAIDADKPAVADVLRTVKRAEYLSTAEAHLRRARACLNDAEIYARDAEQVERYGLGTQSQNVMRHLRDCNNLLTLAREQFKAAGKVSAALGNTQKAADTLAARFREQAAADDRADRINGMHELHAQLVGAFARWKHQQRMPMDASKSYSRGYDVHRLMERMRETLENMRADYPADVPEYITHDAARVDAALSASKLTHELADVRDGLADAIRESSEPPRVGDMRRMLAHCTVPYWAEQMRAALLQVDAYRATYDGIVKARNAQAIEAWRAGSTSGRLPSEVPTMARIRGDVVETSHGANVPIAHACRLARLARRVIRNGGQSWEPGHGPRVGHYEVLRIGADGSATIGCHEFSAEEGWRALHMLASCAACWNELGHAIGDEVTEGESERLAAGRDLYFANRDRRNPQ